MWLSVSSDDLLGAVGRNAGRFNCPEDVVGSLCRLGLAALLAGPDIDDRDWRAATEGGGGGPIDVFGPDGGRAFTADGREGPLMDERVEEAGTAGVDGDLIGDLSGD